MTAWRWPFYSLVIGILLLALPAPRHDLLRAQGPDVRPLRYGETVSGMLNDVHYEDRWTFNGQRGDVIRVTMTRSADVPGGLDGYLLLIGPDGAVLTEVDDTGNAVMPTLAGYELPADGAYTLVATRFGFVNGYSTGEYSLTLELIGRQLAAGAAGGTGVRWLAPGTLPSGLRWMIYNEPVSGRLADDHIEDWYIFQGRAGDEITLRMAAADGALDPFLILTDGSGFELTRADDAPDGSRDALIADLSLPADGAYLVCATRYGFAHGPSAGAYTLVIETDAAPSGPGAAPPLPLVAGLPVSGTLDLQRAVQRYTFEAQAGQQATVTVERAEGTLVPALALHGPDGALLIAGDAGPMAHEARLGPVALPADGTYVVDVSLADLSTAGVYRLIAVVGPPPAPASDTFRPAAGLDIEAVLIWSSAADLDLDVTGPTGTSGLRQAQANDFCAEVQATPVERVTWVEGSAAPGLYPVTVRYRFDCAGAGVPVQFMLGLAVRGAVIDVISATLARPGDTYTTYLALR